MSNCGNDGDSIQKLQQSALADDRWKMVRSAIEHEDNLINQRLSWLFAGHAFLFICFAMLQTTLLSKEVEWEPALTIEMGIAVVLLCAAFIALITHRSVAFAYIHSNALRQWWVDNYNPNEWHYKDRSVISSFLHFFTCGQRPEDFRQVKDLTQQEVASTDATIPSTTTVEKPAASYPPIKGHFPKRFGSIPALMAVMDLALIAVCLGVGLEVGGKKFLEGQVTTPRIESRSNSAGNPGADQGNQQMENDASQGGNEGGGDSGGGSRSAGALNIP
ncbi:MAG: hypothetical protein U0930_20715 [Pirellulales bacterium]